MRRNCRIWTSVLAFCLGALPALAEQPATQPARTPKVKITISRVTTYLLGPVNPDGTINYVAALNAAMSKGVTPENNAAILLIRAGGPDRLPEDVRAEMLKILKLQSLPEKGDYFVHLDDYAELHPDKLPGPRLTAAEQAELKKLEAEFWRRLREGGKLPPPEVQKRLDQLRPKAPGQKAYQQLCKLLDSPAPAKDYPLVAAWLAANKKPLALIVAATKRPRLYVPLLSRSQPPRMLDLVLVMNMTGLRDSARALLGRAMLRLGAGDVAGARADLLAVHRLAGLVCQGPTLVERLTGIAIENLTSSVETALVASGKLTPAQARAQVADLQALPELPDIVEAIDKGERLFSLDCVMMLARGAKIEEMMGAGQKGPWDAIRAAVQRRALDWDVILITLNSWHSRMVAANRRPTFAQRQEATAAMARELNELKTKATDMRGLVSLALQVAAGGRAGRAVLSQKIADLLVGMLMPTLSGAKVLHDRAVMKRRLAVVALALAAYRAEKGEYPAGLAALRPACLKKIPNDLFTEKPLKYSRVGKAFLLYSVGENMADDGGKDRAAGADDIVVRVK